MNLCTRKQYEQWLQQIATTHDSNYWQHIVKYSKYIDEDLKNFKAYKVAKRLQMSPSRLSYIKPLISTLKDLG